MRPKHSTVVRSPWVIVAAVAGLLIAIALVGVVGLYINHRVDITVHRALNYDLALEDTGDDLRIAVLGLRHQHTNLLLTGPSRRGVEELDRSYDEVLEQIDALDTLGLDAPGTLSPDEMRRLATSYYTDFYPAIAGYESNRAAFPGAGFEGLERLDQLETASHQVDKLGESRAATALTSIDRAIERASLLLLLVLSGAVLAAAALAVAAVRVLRELNRAYSAEQQAVSRLTQALQAKTDFVADASHEMRTPLTVVRANADVGRELETASESRELFDEIAHEAVRMTRLVDDLLFLARSDADSPPVELRSLQTNDVLRRVSEAGATLAGQRGVRFEASPTAQGLLRADPSRIEQAVLVLIDNATKYSRPDTLTTLSSRTEGDQVVIEVSDEGRGIPEEDLPRIFDRFYRVDKARTRKHGGSGLGLSIARAIVEAHGGTIEAESRPGKGTTMRLRLPVCTGSQQTADEGTRE